MKAFAARIYGKDKPLQLIDVAVPGISENDVLIKVKAASVNPLDLKIKAGDLKYILPFTFPLILGNDVAGVVSKVGACVTDFTVGDAVYARCNTRRIGSFAEYIAVDSSAVSIKPTNLTMDEAASIPLVGLTCWQVLVERANIQPGQKVFIHAGSGGIGTFAIQLAKHRGAYVATTASETGRNLIEQLGADEIIDYTKEDFSTKLKNYDFVFDTLGGKTLEQSLSVLKPGGEVISIAGAPDYAFAKAFGLNPLLRVAMFFLSYKIRTSAQKGGASYSFHFMYPSGDQLNKIRSLLEAKTIRPVIDTTFTFEETNEALDYVATGRAKGKVITTVND